MKNKVYDTLHSEKLTRCWTKNQQKSCTHNKLYDKELHRDNILNKRLPEMSLVDENKQQSLAELYEWKKRDKIIWVVTYLIFYTSIKF